MIYRISNTVPVSRLETICIISSLLPSSFYNFIHRNLWNFNPIHVFTDSSGMYWRERRLTPGLYTDGKVVYESAYRYTDGRAGMKPVSSLDAFLKSSTVKRDAKENLLRRLKEDSPDVVVEE